MEEKNEKQTTEDNGWIYGWAIIGAIAMVSYKIGNIAGRSLISAAKCESYKKGVCDTLETVIMNGK